MKPILIVLAALLLLTGCASKRDQAVVDSAATIWEAAEALRQGASVDAITHSIQANASAICAAFGCTYPPEKKP